MNAIVDEKRLEGAINFLAETDGTYAEQKAAMENAEILRKRVRAKVFLTATGNNEERKSKAETNMECCNADDAYIAALQAFETTKARRQRAELVVDVWRTISANLRRGNV